MESNLKIIKKRFPDRSGLVESLYQDNPAFNSLCEDYCAVDEQLGKLKVSENAISAVDIKALKTLLRELETEFALYFENAPQA